MVDVEKTFETFCRGVEMEEVANFWIDASIRPD
jgi:hypothetical protein